MPTLAAWVHSLSPFFVRFTDDFGLRWYGLSYAAAFLLAWLLLRWLAARGATQIPRERAGDAILYCVAGVVIGGRLGYVFFYQPSLLWTTSRSPPWWGVLAINQGGMASHGGMIGAIIACWFVSRWLPVRTTAGRAYLHVLDSLALTTPWGLMLGRLANFINGELLGKIVADPDHPAPWWAVKFPQERLPGSGHEPLLTSQQQDGLSELVVRTRLPGQSYEEGYRHLVELIQRGRHDLAEQLSPFLAARHPSQLYQAFCEGIVVGVILWWIARRPRYPGIVGCWFLISYGILRIVNEAFWRLPDAIPHPYILGLTRGQWLSAAMIAIGLVFLTIIKARNGEKMGGWKRLEGLAF